MVKTLDKDNIKDKDKFKERANKIRKEREEHGVGSLYSEMQPRVRPEINQDFVGQRIDVLFIFDILDAVGDEPDQGLRWCQGKVTKVFTIKDKKKPMVEVAWDEVQESIDGQSKTNVILHANKWRKECEGAWRMDINIDREDGNDNDNQDV